MAKSLWDKVREEAEEAIDRTRELRILASDIDGREQPDKMQNWRE